MERSLYELLSVISKAVNRMIEIRAKLATTDKDLEPGHYRRLSSDFYLQEDIILHNLNLVSRYHRLNLAGGL